MIPAPLLNLATMFDEATRLRNEGFCLLPLMGKKSVVKFADLRPLPLSVILDKVSTGAANAFGVLLGGLAVLDIDSRDAALVTQLQNRFGSCDVITKTPSGYHLFYRFSGGSPPNLRQEGLPVDVKTGRNSYVVGPSCVRPDGSEYQSISRPLAWENLSFLRDTSSSTSADAVESPHYVGSLRNAARLVPLGGRHNHLKQLAAIFAAQVNSNEQLFERLIRARDTDCADPLSLPSSEVRRLADDFWKYRLENRLYAGRHSSFRVERSAVDSLGGNPNAIALYTILKDRHGHTPGKMFSLDQYGMKAEGLLVVGRDAFRAAIALLIERGLLQVAENHVAGKQKRQYRLCTRQVHNSAIPIMGGTRRGALSLNYVDRFPSLPSARLR